MGIRTVQPPAAKSRSKLGWRLLSSPVRGARMLPQRPPGSSPVPPGLRKPDSMALSAAQSFELLKVRVLARLKDRLDPNTSKRMPLSLLRQSLRTHAEQVAELEARGLPRAERDRLVEAVLAEFLGYGPLQELFDDPSVQEIQVIGPHAIIARRHGGDWLPANLRFRDEAHLREALDKLATHADAVGPVLVSLNTFDLRLPNGFRAIGVIPPPALGVSPVVAFVRTEDATAAATPPPTPTTAPVPTPVASPPTAPSPSVTLPRPASAESAAPPAARPHPDHDPLLRHRDRIIERLISRLASLGVYDLQRVEVTELRKIVAAYVTEYLQTEKIYLSDTDEGRLQLEILALMRR